MHNYSAIRSRRMLLAAFVASSVLFCSAQTSTTTPPATKPAPKKTTTTGASKTATAAKTTGPVTLETDKEKTSYAIGADLGTKLKTAEIDVDPAILSRAIKDVLSGSKTAMTDDEIRAKLMDLSKGLQAKQQ